MCNILLAYLYIGICVCLVGYTAKTKLYVLVSICPVVLPGVYHELCAFLFGRLSLRNKGGLIRVSCLPNYGQHPGIRLGSSVKLGQVPCTLIADIAAVQRQS